MRIPALAVVRHYVDSRVEVHSIGALSAVDGVFARVIVRLDYIIAGTGLHRVDAAIVSTHKVCAVPAEHTVVAKAAPKFVSAPLTRGCVVAAVTLYSLATVEGPTGTTRDRIVASVTSDAVYAACAGEVVAAATASYVVRTVGTDEGIGPRGAVEGHCQGHPACK